MTVRTLTENDLPRLIDLYQHLSPDNASMVPEKVREVFFRDVLPKDILYLGAEADGALIATCFLCIIPNLTRDSRPFGLIENVVTHPDYRRVGAAKAVIERAVEIAKENSCYKVMLQSGANRTEAHAFYQALGFDGDSKRAFELRF